MFRSVIAHLIIIIITISASPAWARSDVGRDTNAEVEMDVLLNIPSHVTLQIGSGGTVIDTVTFIVTQPPTQQPTVTSDISPQVIVSTNVNTGITLAADSSGALVGESRTIPFSSISWQGTGAFEGSEASFDGTPNQIIRSFSGRGTYSGTFNFTFHNSYAYPPGIYTGTIMYTVTSP